MKLIERVTFARCAFIFALRNIAVGGYLDTRRTFTERCKALNEQVAYKSWVAGPKKMATGINYCQNGRPAKA